MTPNESKNLLNTLKEKGDFSRPLKPQIAQLFIKAPWSDKVYARHSWKGRAISWLRLPHEVKIGEEKACQIFAKLLRSHLSQSQETPLTSNQARRYQELLETTPEESRKTADKPLNPALEKIKARKEKDKQIDPKTLFATSYLLEPTEKKETFDEKRLETLFTGEMTPSLLEEIGKFLKAHPHLDLNDFETKSASLMKALQESREWASKAKEARKQGEAQLEQFLETTTQNLHGEICALKAVGGEVKTLSFSYGNPHPTLDTFLKRVERLPESMKKQIPQPILDFLKSGELASPEAYALKLLDSRMPENMPLRALWPLSPLMADPRRGLPIWLERRLPTLVKNFCNERLQEGPLVNVARFVPLSSLSVPLSLAGHFGNYLIDKRVVHAQVLGTLKNTLGISDASVESAAGSLKNMIGKLPLSLQSMLGFSQGPLWLEFQRAADNTFNLTIYTNGDALAFHPLEPKSQNPYLVRRLKGIPESKLTEEFLSLLLRQTLEPCWNDEAESTSDEFYKTLLPTLGGSALPPKDDDPLSDPSDESTPAKLVERLLFKKANETLFLMQWEAFLKACRSFQPASGSPLTFKKLEDLRKLEGYTLLMEAEVKNQKASPEKKRLEITLKHIRYDLEQAQKKYKEQSLEASFITQMRQEAAEKGVNQDTIDAISSTLSWALSCTLGDEMGQRVAPLWDDLSSDLRNNLSPAPPPAADRHLFPALHALKEGWLRDWAAGNWRLLSWQVLQLVLVGTSIYTGGISYSLPVLWTHLSKFLPAPVLRALHRLELAVLTLSVEFMLYVVRSLFLDQETREGWVRSLQSTHQKITGQTSTLSLTLTKPAPKISPLATSDGTIKFTSWKGGGDSSVLNKSSPHSIFGFLIPKPVPKTGLSDADLYRALNEWISTAETIAPLDPANPLQTLSTDFVNGFSASRSAICYLFRQIERLEVPSLTTPTQWDRVENPGECLKAVGKLSTLVTHLHTRLHDKIPVETAFALHHLAAITYHLFNREFNTPFKECPLNIHPFVVLLKTSYKPYSEPQLFSRGEAICRYLAPGIDLRVPHGNNPKKQNPDYNYFKNRPGLFPDHDYFDFRKKPYLFMEHDYSLLNIKRGQILFDFFSIADKNFLSPLLLKPELGSLKDPEKRLYLFLLSFLEKSDYPLFSLVAPLALLKRSAQTCYNFNKLYFSYKQDEVQALIDTLFHFNEEGKVLRKALPAAKRGLFGFSYNSEIETTFIENFEKFLVALDSSISPLNFPRIPTVRLHDRIDFLNDPENPVAQPYCQAPLIDNSFIRYASKFDLTLSEKDLVLLLTRCAPESRIILTLNYFKENSDKWEENLCGFITHDPQDINHPLEYLNNALFSPHALFERLQESPQFAQTLGELFENLIQTALNKNQINLALTFSLVGLKAAKACEYHLPGSRRHFPDFNRLLSHIPDKEGLYSPYGRLAFSLKVLAIDNFEATSLKDLILALLLENQPTTTTMILLSDIFRSEDLNTATRQKLHEALPEIREALRNPDLREEVLNGVIKALHLPLEKHSTPWKQIENYCYQSGELTLDLFKGALEGFENRLTPAALAQRDPLLQKALGKGLLKDLKRRLISEKPLTEGIDEGVLVTKEGDYQVHFTHAVDPKNRHHKTITFRATTCLDGLRFELANPCSTFSPEILKELECEKSEEVVVWHSPYALCLVAPNRKFKFIHVSDKVYSESLFVSAPVKLQSVELSSKRWAEGLSPLFSFCPEEEIRCSAIEGESVLSSIDLKKYGLEFQVRNKRAFSVQYPGYAIAPQQRHPALYGLQSFLLLESEGGRKKVLLPKRQWLPGLLSRLTSPLGKMEPFCLSALPSQTLGSLTTTTYSLLDLDEEEREEESLLKSDHPEALSDLLLLYLCRGKSQQAEGVCRLLEQQLSSNAVSENIWQDLVVLAYLPVSFEGIDRIRMRLFSLMESNRLLFPADSKPSYKMDPWEHMAISFCLFKDLNDHLKTPKDQRWLSPNQEYFLFKSGFWHLREMFSSSLNAFKGPLALLDAVGWDRLIQLINPLPELQSRWQKLKKKREGEDSFLAKAFDFALKASKTSGDLPPLLSAGSLAHIHTPTSVIGHLEHSFYKHQKIHQLVADTPFLEGLFKKMENSLDPHPEVKPGKITPEHFTKHFATYYSLARGDSPTKELYPLAALKRLKEKSSYKERTLIELLEAIAKKPDLYPSTRTLLETQTAYFLKSLPEALNPVANYCDYDSPQSFFTTLRNTTLLGAVAETVLEPLLKSSVLMSALNGTSKALREQIAPLTSGGFTGLAGLQLSFNFLERSTTEQLYHILYPRTSSLPGCTNLLKGTPRQVLLKAGGLVVGSSFVSMAAGYVARRALSPLTSLLPASATAAAAVLPVAATLVIRYLRPEASPGLTVGQILPYRHVSAPVLNAAVRCWRMARENRPAAVPQKLKSDRVGPEALLDFSPLIEEDEATDAFLKSLLDLAFTTELPSIDHERRAPLYTVRSSDSEITRKRFEKINNSLKAYYEDPERHLPCYSLKNEEALRQVHLQITLYRQALKEQLEQEEGELLSLFEGKVSFERLHTLIEKKRLAKLFGLTPEETALIELSTGRLDLRRSRLHQIERLSASFNRLFNSSRFSAYYAEMEKIALELSNSTQFSLKTTPPRLLRLNLQFQAFSQKMLWKRQAANREKILYSGQRGAVTEEPPGDGKTAYGIPLSIAHEVGKNELVLPIIPRQLAGEIMPKIASQLRSLFNMASWRVQITRDQSFTSENFSALLALMKGAIKGGEPLLMTKEDAQSLASLLIDRWHGYTKVKGFASGETKRCLILQHRVQKLLQGVAIPDEAHETYRFLQMLNFPIGTPKTVEKELYQITESVARAMASDPELFSYLKSNTLTELDGRHYESVIRPRLAEKLSHTAYLKLSVAQKGDFIAYVCEKTSSIPAWIKQDKELFQKCALYKGMLNGLFTMNLDSRAQVEYSATEGKEEFAGPNEGNSFRLEGDTLECPYQTLMKTYLLYFATGLSRAQCANILQRLATETYTQAKRRQLSVFQMPFVLKYGHALTFEENQAEVKSNALDTLTHDSDLILHYIRRFVFPTIRYWKKTILNDSYFFASLFNRQLSCTGTPYNHETYPNSLTLLHDPKIVGEMLHLVHQKTPENGIHVLSSVRPQEVVAEILNTFFPAGSPIAFSMIVDGGALFTGMGNEEVALMMKEHFEHHHPEVHSIKFYKKNSAGIEEIYCFVRGIQEAMPLSSLNVDPATSITYYSERQGFGADIPQVKNGVMTLGPRHADYKRLQQFFRNRGTKRSIRLKENSNQPNQVNHVVMTREVQKLITGSNDKVPTLLEIGEFALRQEAQIAEQENYPALIKQILSVPKCAAFRKVLEVDSDDFKTWMALMSHFEPFFINDFEDDPSRLFGWLKKESTPDEALPLLAAHVGRKVDSNPGFSLEEKASIKKQIAHLIAPSSRPPLPARITLLTEGSENRENSLQWDLHNTEQQQTLQQSAEQKEQLQQQEKEELQEELEQQEKLTKNPTRFDYQEWPWPQIEDPTSLSWLTFSSPSTSYHTLNPLYLFQSPACPLFKVQALLKASPEKALNNLSQDFDRRLWMPNNFLPRHHLSLRERSVDLGSKEQYKLTQVLIHAHLDGPNLIIDHLGPLSVADAAQWRKRLSSKPINWDSSPTKVFVWDVTSRSHQAGCPLPQNDLRNHHDLNLLIAQLKLLDGETDFTAELPSLIAWLTHNEKDPLPDRLKEAFEFIHKARGLKDYRGTPFETLLLSLLKATPQGEEF